MKKLNEYKRITKGILTKMLEEAKQGLRAFEIVSSYKYTEYCNDTEQLKNRKMSIERMEYLIKDLEMFSFIQLRIQSNGDLNIYYHSNENLTIKEIEVKEEKEVVQTIEVIEEVQEIAPEATKEEIEASEEVEAIQTTISFKTAESAFRNTSFTPEVRAKSVIASSNKEIKLFLNELLALAPEEKGNIILDVKEWASKYDNKKIAWLNAMSRTASAMITGPANFPTARNNKRNETAHNRNQELLDWMEKSKKALIKKYTAKEEEKDIIYFVNEAYQEMKKYTKEELSRFAKVLIKDRLMRKIVNYANISFENLKEAQEITTKETVFFTAKHKIHDTLKNIESKFTRISEGIANKEFTINNIKIVDSEENNRIELYFEGIPSVDIRNYLKSKGFKWSPTKKAWQNFRSSLRLTEIKKYIEMIEIIDI